MARLRTGLVLAFLLFAGQLLAADPVQKRYPLPGQGTFTLTVPAGWKDTLRPDGTRPPTIFLRAPKGREPQVKLTPIWRARPDVPPFTRENVRANVAKGIDAVREQALEKEIPLTEFPGGAGPGWYFDATDKAPKAGEYKYLRSGMLIVGDLLVAFAILSDGRDEPVMAEAMRILQGAAHVPK